MPIHRKSPFLIQTYYITFHIIQESSIATVHFLKVCGAVRWSFTSWFLGKLKCGRMKPKRQINALVVDSEVNQVVGYRARDVVVFGRLENLLSSLGKGGFHSIGVHVNVKVDRKHWVESI
jgi:hypothetical protein